MLILEKIVSKTFDPLRNIFERFNPRLSMFQSHQNIIDLIQC